MTEEKTERSPTDMQLDEAEKQARALDALIGQIQGPGYTAILWRLQPSWCDGYLEEFEIDPEVGLDMDYITSMWGGHKHAIKLKDKSGRWVKGVELKLKSWKPRHRGVLLNRFDDFSDINPARGNPPGANLRYKQPSQDRRIFTPPVVENQFDPNKMMEQMFGMFKDFQKTMAKQQPAPTGGMLDGPSAVPGDPFGQMMQGVKFYKEMQKIFGGAEKVMDSDTENEQGIYGTIGQILGMMNRQQAAPVQQPPSPPPRRELPPGGRVVNDTDRPSPAPPMDLPGTIASLSPQQIADIIVSAASRMDPDQRENAFAEVAGRLAGLEGVEYEDDESSNEEELELDDESSPEPVSDTD